MRLTRSAEHALGVVLYLAGKGESGATATEIAAARGFPRATLSTVLGRLSRLGLLRARAGRGGGYCLSRGATAIGLREVIEAVDGPISSGRCPLHGLPCGEAHWCPVHESWEAAQKAFVSVLGRWSVGELAARVRRWDAAGATLREILSCRRA